MKAKSIEHFGKRVLVCGAGSIGRRHISNLLLLGVDVSVWRARSELLADLAKDFPVRICNELSIAIENVDGVVVATSTDNHLAIAEQTLNSGKALYIEKPLSHDWVGVDELGNLAKGKVIEIGCQFRSHPNLIDLEHKLSKSEFGKSITYRLAMGHRLDAWRPSQDYRQGYSARSERGGGALFDLIHQIDIALWLFGPATGVNAVMAKLGSLDIEADDVSNILLSHKSGVTGHIQLDMTSPVYRCEVEVMTCNSILRWDNSDGKLRQFTPHGETVIDSISDGFERNDLFLKHMTHWLKRIDNPNLSAACGFQDGVAALKVALCARKASLLQKTVFIQ